MKADKPVFITTEQLAERWNISAATIRNQRFKGIGPSHFKPFGKLGKVLYRLDVIEAWERANTTEGARR